MAWTYVNKGDTGKKLEWFNAMKDVTTFYKNEAKEEEIEHVFKDKDQVKGYVWKEDDGSWETRIAFCYKNGLGHHYLINSAIKGNPTFAQVFAKQLEAGQMYIEEFKVKQISWKQPKGLLGINAIMTRAKLIPELKKHFKDAYVEKETDEAIMYTIDV